MTQPTSARLSDQAIKEIRAGLLLRYGQEDDENAAKCCADINALCDMALASRTAEREALSPEQLAAYASEIARLDGHLLAEVYT